MESETMHLQKERIISTVIPSWNRAKTVGRAIESVLAQTCPPAKVIVVDDGSEDDTQAVVRAFGDAVHYVRQANGGASNARNRGVRECCSPWVAFLDSDDIWDPDHIARMLAAIHDTDGRACLYFSDTLWPTDRGGGRWWKRCGFICDGRTCMVKDGTEWAMLDFQPMILPSSVIERKAYLDAGGMWEELKTREDTHFFCNLCIGKAVCAVSGIGAIVTSVDPIMRLSSFLGHRTKPYWQCSVRMWQDLLKRFPELERRHQRKLKHRLGTSYLRLARFSLDQRDFRQFVQAAAKAFALHPCGIMDTARRKCRWRGVDVKASPAIKCEL